MTAPKAESAQNVPTVINYTVPSALFKLLPSNF